MRLINTEGLNPMAAVTVAATFTQVALTPPLNWVSGTYLFPTEIIAGYNAPVADYNATAWDAYILASCESYSACTSAIAFQGMILTYWAPRIL
jgi:hypothetical protein